jgi:hypothetical protein
MTKNLFLATLVIITCSMQANTNIGSDKDIKIDSVTNLNRFTSKRIHPLINKTEKFLWREKKYDNKLKGTFSTIIINEKLCKTLSEPERAALGFVVTFIGSECNWDGEAKDDRSNLKCKTLTSLRLGYQCSEEHLGFLRKWFANDNSSIKELKDCPTTPYTASIQETFDYINLTVKGNLISVEFGANGVNMQNNDATWSWSETDYFQVDNQSIKLIKKNKSKIKHD